MGQSLSEPKTEKETADFESGDYVVAVSGMQGWRSDMEDAWSVQLPLCPMESSSAYFAVFDGHGSRSFSAYSAQHLHSILVDNSSFCAGDYAAGLRQSFHGLDVAMQQDESSLLYKESGGTTAVVVLIKDSCIFCANVGDSRAIASRNGQLEELSYDHKPSLPAEKNRIYKAGGWVEFNRVNGNLALSRALGDFEFKNNSSLSAEEQMVTADPDIISLPLSPQHEFLVLACDGVWDVMTSAEVLEFVRIRIAENNMSPSQICESLLDHCLAPDCRMGGVGCDNMTVILVCFLHGNTYTHLIERCSHPCPSPLTSDPSPPPGPASSGHPRPTAGESSHHHVSGTFLGGMEEGKNVVSSYCHTAPLDLRGSSAHKTGRQGEVVSEMKHCNSQGTNQLTKPQQLSCTV